MPKSVRDAVSEYLSDTDHVNGFRKLLNITKSACESAKDTLGPSIVYRIYGREDRQGDSSFLKSREKIELAILRLQERDPAASIDDVTDIIDADRCCQLSKSGE